MKYLITFIIVCLFGIDSIFAISENDVSSLIDKTNNLLNEQIENENLNKRFPVGSIYISTNVTNPTILFGGTWEIYSEGRKLVGMGSNGTTNYTTVSAVGGSESLNLSINNIPSHVHSLTPSGSVSSTFTGSSVTSSSNGAHTHTFSFGRASSEASGYGLMYDLTEGVYRDRPAITSQTVNVNGAGTHSHSLTSSGSVISTFNGNTITTSSNGSSSSIDIMNPYVTVYMWKRVS